MTWWVRLLGLLVPVRWRDTVVQEVSEEAASRRSALRAVWLAASLVAIGFRFRAAAVAEALGQLTQARWTGFIEHECRQAVRRLFRSPASSLAVVVTLATAMGAAIATFSLVQSLVLDPLPFREPMRLVAVWQAETSAPDNWLGTSLFNFVEWKKRARTLERIVAVRNTSLTLTDFEDGGTPLMQRVSHGYFELLGVDPILGRTFTEDEDRAGGPLAVMLSAELWRQRFGGDPGVIGRRMTLDGRGYTIVGVTPAGHENPVFGLVDRPQAFVALQAPVAMTPDPPVNVLVIGRLAAGGSIEAVRDEFRQISAGLQREHPATHRTVDASVQPLAERQVRSLRRPLFLLMAAVLAVLLAACGNVANLLLARAIASGAEVPVRKALGAAPLRVALQRVTEAIVLAAVSAAGGLFVALLLVRLLPLAVPQGFFLPKYAFSLNARIVFVAAAFAIAAGILAALPSAAVALRASTAEALRIGRSTASRRERRWSLGLVTLEIVSAVVLLCGGALAVSGLRALMQTSPGFDAERASTFRSSVRGDRYRDPEQRRAYFEGLEERLAALPGVEAVGVIDTLPVFTGVGQQTTIATPSAAAGEELRVSVRTGSSGVRRALGLALIEGRWFEDTDGPSTRPLAVVTQSLPAALGIAGSIVGQHVRVTSGARTALVEVIGVAREMRSALQPDRSVPVVYLPYEQAAPGTDLAFVVRTRGTDPNLMANVRREAAKIDRSAAIYLPRTMGEVAASMNSSVRFVSILLSIFGGLALLLVAVGVYGTLSCIVNARRVEFGVRRAIGASAPSLLALVLRDAMRPALTGVAIGLLLAVWFGQVLASQVRGTPGSDPWVFAGVGALLLVTAACSALWPALRAARVDPVIAMRGES